MPLAPPVRVLADAVTVDLDSIDRGDLDRRSLQQACARWSHYGATPAPLTADRIARAEVVVTNKVVLGAEHLAEAKRLTLVCIAATGTNNVDLEAARARGIAVANVTGYATPSVVQHVLAVMLRWATRLESQIGSVRAGAWSRSAHFCLLTHLPHELAGRRLGVVGYGELGRAVAEAAGALGMQVLIAERPGGLPAPGRLPLKELLPMVDVLSLHCPLADNTRDLIGAEELRLMRRDALLINTARGGIVDEPALADALRAGVIGAAAVDTLTAEPPPPDHPLLAPDIPNLIITPHVAWASREARQRLIDEVAKNISAFAAGEARNRVV